MDGSSRGWTRGKREGGKYKKKGGEGMEGGREGSSVLLKTGGQTVCNWLGPQGLKERFKERREREIESKLTDSGGKTKRTKRRKGKR